MGPVIDCTFLPPPPWGPSICGSHDIVVKHHDCHMPQEVHVFNSQLSVQTGKSLLLGTQRKRGLRGVLLVAEGGLQSLWDRGSCGTEHAWPEDLPFVTWLGFTVEQSYTVNHHGAACTACAGVWLLTVPTSVHNYRPNRW